MSAYDIPKNMLALLGALALAALFATVQPAQAEDAPENTPAEAHDVVAHHIELDVLRQLLSTPHLSHEERHQLLQELNEITEEFA